MRAMLAIWLLAAAALGAVAVASLLADDRPPASTPRSADDAQASPVDMAALIHSLTVFVLAIFVGFEVITKVPPTLHTPLMSGSNAISGITIVGALLVAGGAAASGSRVWGLFAVLLASINVVGGFLVTHRMLDMFRKKK